MMDTQQRRDLVGRAHRLLRGMEILHRDALTAPPGALVGVEHEILALERATSVPEATREIGNGTGTFASCSDV